MRLPARTLFVVSIFASLISSPALCWGPTGHTLVTEQALVILPVEMKPFYDANSRYIVALTTLPDDWKQTHKAEEGPDHFIDLDLLDNPPFTNVIGDRAAAEKRFGKDKLLQAGVLPWVIAERYAKLVNAFKKQDSEEIVVQSALLAHYVGDAHVPLHATKLYDGKTPEQKGIHFRWEENLIALTLKPQDLKPTKPENVDGILKSAFAWCISSYDQIGVIFDADDKARERDPGYGYAYFQVLSRESGSALRTQLSTAAEALAGVYVSAWREAGSPKLSDKAAPLFWGY